jgi:hypothetical protein
MDPKPNPFLVASQMTGGTGDQTHLWVTLSTVVAGALVIFVSGLLLGVVLSDWMRRGR